MATNRTRRTPARTRARAKCKEKTKAGKRCTRTAKVDGLCPQHAALVTQEKPWTERFLEAFVETGQVSAACKVAGVGRSTVYDERQRNEEFALAWHDAELEATDRLEAEAFRRAHDGVDEPVYQKGQQVGTIRRYSDKLLIVLLQARKPETYRPTHRLEHTGARGGPIATSPNPEYDFSQLPDEDLYALKRIYKAAKVGDDEETE